MESGPAPRLHAGLPTPKVPPKSSTPPGALEIRMPPSALRAQPSLDITSRAVDMSVDALGGMSDLDAVLLPTPVCAVLRCVRMRGVQASSGGTDMVVKIARIPCTLARGRGRPWCRTRHSVCDRLETCRHQRQARDLLSAQSSQHGHRHPAQACRYRVLVCAVLGALCAGVPGR